MVEAVGWDMYDPRMTLKGTLVETVHLGDCCYIAADGIHFTDATETIHGCALMAGVLGDEIVLITHGRLKMVDIQVPGVLVYGPDGGSGAPPDESGAGKVCGFAIRRS